MALANHRSESDRVFEAVDLILEACDILYEVGHRRIRRLEDILRVPKALRVPYW